MVLAASEAVSASGEDGRVKLSSEDKQPAAAVVGDNTASVASEAGEAAAAVIIMGLLLEDSRG